MEEQISTDKERRFNSNENVLHDFFERFPEVVSLIDKYIGLSFFMCEELDMKYQDTIIDTLLIILLNHCHIIFGGWGLGEQ